MLKVLHLLYFTGTGGTESYINSLIKKLHKNRCEFYLAYSKEGPGHSLFKDMGIQLIQMDMKSPYDLKAAYRLSKLCKELSIDIIHTHFLRENYISIFSKIFGNKVPVINTCHMLYDNSKTVITMNKILTRHNSKIIAVSNAVKEHLISEGIEPKKIQVVYNGIDIDYWEGEKDNNIRKEFNIADDAFLIGSVSRFSQEKGHTFFLEAIAYLKNLIKANNLSVPDIKYILVGRGSLLEQCKSLAADLGISDDVVFTGYRTDIKSILKNCDLFVCHSKSEALGISILEAMTCGLPVIATDSGGTREIIGKNNDFGMLVNYGDKEGLTDAIIKLIQDKELYNKYQKEGRNLVVEKFNLDITSNQTYTIYSSVNSQY
ncbi:MAG TPA: glycosyltransferase family 4 protein [Clostridiales bacterium]|nr:glycosyltransferase family 4 protein [Clostridiales bacterium]